MTRKSTRSFVSRGAVLALSIALAAIFTAAAFAVTIPTVPVGNAGNAGEVQSQGTFGAVAYDYRNETLILGSLRGHRGGSWNPNANLMLTSVESTIFGPQSESDLVGFRVATAPEPDTAVLAVIACGLILWWGRRRKSRCAVGPVLLALCFCAMPIHSLAAATISHIYELNGSLSDDLGGPGLIPIGGALTATDFVFGNPANAVNEGLSVSNAFANPGDYSIEMRFRWTGDLGGWGRILDFNTTNDDRGIYTHPSNRMIYWTSGPIGTSTMGINSDFHVVFTRSSATQTFRAYLNGASQFQFVDGAGLTSFSSPGNPALFFMDDNTPFDTRPGIVDQIRIFDGAVNATEVSTLFSGGGLSRSPVPAPGGPYSILAGEALNLDASASIDPDQEFGDSISLYQWDLNDDGLFDFSSSVPTLGISAAQYAGLLATGMTTARLRATDAIGQHRAVSTFTIEVLPVPEPSALVLAGFGALAFLLAATRKIAPARIVATATREQRSIDPGGT